MSTLLFHPPSDGVFEIDSGGGLSIAVDRLDDAEGALVAALSAFIADRFPDRSVEKDILPGIPPVVVASGLPAALGRAVALAAWRTGCTVAFLDAGAGRPTLAQLLDAARPRLWFHLDATALPAADPSFESIDLDDPDVLDELERAGAASVDPSASPAAVLTDRDAAVLLPTSGSTGTPKLVTHSLQACLHSAALFAETFDLRPTDRLSNLAPLHTMSGFRGSILLPLTLGATLVDEPEDGSVDGIVRHLVREAASVLITGPVLLAPLARAAEGGALGDALRLVLCTGAASSAAHRRALRRACGARVIDYYGQTETCGLVIADVADAGEGHLGRACRGVSVSVRDVSTGTESATGVGELVVRAPQTFLGYLRAGSGVEPASPGEVATGDEVSIDASGDIRWRRRLGRSVKHRSTLWLHPDLVETWLVEHAGATDAHVEPIRQPDSAQVLRLRARVVAPPGAACLDPAATCAALALKLGAVYADTEIVEAARIARSPLGKVVPGASGPDQP